MWKSSPVARAGAFVDSRCGLHDERRDAAPVEREFFDALMFHDSGEGAIDGLDRRGSFAGDGDFAGRADNERGVDDSLLSRGELEDALPGLHSGGLDSDAILAGLHGREEVEAGFVGGGVVLTAGVDAEGRDATGRNGCARGVANGSL